MTEQENWKWWVGFNEETYHTECDTREEAAYIAREEYEGGWIIEARKPSNIPLEKYFDAERFLEDAEDRAHDYYGDPETGDPVFDITAAQIDDLDTMVRETIGAWQKKHSLVFTGWAFTASRNSEYIPGPDEDD